MTLTDMTKRFLSSCFFLALCVGARPGYGQTPALPTPDRSGIEHVVVVTMENRSYDHILGWLAGANGQQAGVIARFNVGGMYYAQVLSSGSGFTARISSMICCIAALPCWADSDA